MTQGAQLSTNSDAIFFSFENARGSFSSRTWKRTTLRINFFFLYGYFLRFFSSLSAEGRGEGAILIAKNENRSTSRMICRLTGWGGAWKLKPRWLKTSAVLVCGIIYCKTLRKLEGKKIVNFNFIRRVRSNKIYVRRNSYEYLLRTPSTYNRNFLAQLRIN